MFIQTIYHKSKMIYLICLTFLISFSVSSQNVLMSYDVNSWTNGIANPPTYADHISGLTINRHNVGMPATNACFATSQWNGANPVLDTLSTKYVSYSVFAESGYLIHVDTFSFASYGSGTAPKYGYWGYKVRNSSWIISPKFTFTTNATLYTWSNLGLTDADSVEFRFWALDAGGNTASIGGTSNVGSAGSLRMPGDMAGNDLWLSGSVIQTSCPAPASLQIESLTHNKAGLSWDSSVANNSFTVYYRKTGNTEWMHASAYPSHIILSGLADSSTYEWKVKSNCTNGESHWVAGSNFTTLARPLLPSIQSSSANLNFGSLLIHNHKTDTIYITGTDLSTPISLSITDDTLHYFSIEIDSLPPASNNAVVVIHYMPLTEGIHQASLVLTSDTTQLRINLSGKGFSLPALLLKEYFEYPIGDTLCKTTNDTTADVVTGWRIHSSGANPITVGEPLTFFRYDASHTGGSAVLNNTGQDINKRFETQTNHEIFYTVFLLRVHAAPQDYFMHLLKENSKSAFTSRVWLNSGATGIGISGAASPDSYLPFAKDSTFLIVLKHKVSDIADSACTALYVFNTFPENEPTEPHQIYYGDGKSPVNAIALRQNDKNQNIKVSGLRIAKTWQEAVKIAPCIPVSELTAKDIHPKYAKLTWKSDAPLYKISYHMVDSSDITTLYSRSTALSLFKLQSSTNYHCEVSAICGNGDTSLAVSCDFTTLDQRSISIITPAQNQIFDSPNIEVIYSSKFCDIGTTNTLLHVLIPSNIKGYTNSDTITLYNLPSNNYTLLLMVADSNHKISDSTIYASLSFSIDLPCDAPTDLNVDSISNARVKLSWHGTADSYRLLYDFETGGAIQSKTISGNSVWIDSLQPHTEYRWSITALCGLNSESENIYGENFTTTSTNSIENRQWEDLIRISPNPAHRFITIEANNIYDETIMKIFNSMGKVMYQEAITLCPDMHKQIDISSFPSGIYFIEWTVGQVKHVKKFIVDNN